MTKMLVRTPQARPARSLDYAAGFVARVLPHGAARRVDQSRRDLGVLLDAARGRRPSPVATREVAVERAPHLDELRALDLLPGPVARRLGAAHRDFRMVYDRVVRGRRRVPVYARPPTSVVELSRPIGTVSATVGRPMRVERVVQETNDAVSIYLAEVNGAPLRFAAGQFLSFDLVIAGEKLRRAYSIAAPAEGAGSDAPHVTIKRVADGRASNYLNEQATVGMHLDAFGPSGNFTLERIDRLAAAPDVLLVAGGSGITPIISLAATWLHRHQAGRATLIYGNRSERDVIFAERLRELVATYAGRLVVDHVLAEPEGVWEDVEVATGILDAATLGARLDALGVDPATAAGCYICGPTPMMDAARELLRGRGVSASRLHEERFSRPEHRESAVGSAIPEPMTIRTADGTRTAVVKPGQTLLEAGLGASIQMPFSCAMGGCGACAMVCTEGEVAMEEPNCLSEAERARGEVLTCIGYPKGPVFLRFPERP